MSKTTVLRTAAARISATLMATVATLIATASPALAAGDQSHTSGLDLLPGFRWSSPTDGNLLYTSRGLGAFLNPADTIISSIFNGIAAILLTLADFMWQAMMWVAAFATSDGVQESMLAPTNEFFAGIAGAVFGSYDQNGTFHLSGVALAIFAVAMIGVIGAIMRRGRRASFIGRTSQVIAAFAVLSYFVVSVALADGEPFGTGTPGWFAKVSLDSVTDGAQFLASGPIVDGDWGVTGGTMQDVAGDGRSGGGKYSCIPYVERLYLEAKSQKVDPTAIMLSRLWEYGWAIPYYQAQFGSTWIGEDVGCRILEGQADVSIHDQYMRQSLTGNAAPYDIFLVRGDPSDLNVKRVLLWASCAGDGPGGNMVTPWQMAQTAHGEFSCAEAMADMGSHAAAQTTPGFRDKVAENTGKVIKMGSKFVCDLGSYLNPISVTDVSEGDPCEADSEKIGGAVQNILDAPTANEKLTAILEERWEKYGTYSGSGGATGTYLAARNNDRFNKRQLSNEFSAHVLMMPGITDDAAPGRVAAAFGAAFSSAVAFLYMMPLVLGLAFSNVVVMIGFALLPVSILLLAMHQTRSMGRRALYLTIGSLTTKVVLMVVFLLYTGVSSLAFWLLATMGVV